jgi:hypothetical protein
MVRSVLRAAELTPVLVDVGSSAGAPPIWGPIAGVARQIGFDPDLRDLREEAGRRFHRSTTVPAAVVADDVPETTFYLTRSPYCSSTLPPDVEALEHFLFADLFQVERTVTVKATTFSRVIEEMKLAHVDWLKIDSQGTDLRLYSSVPAAFQESLLALDVEPGLIDAYEGEDLFVEVQRTLSSSGWWLSQARVLGDIRISRPAIQELQSRGITPDDAKGNIRSTPAWVEARYLRTVEHLQRRCAGSREWTILWAFAMIDGQYGFAWEVAQAGSEATGEKAARVMRDAAEREISRTSISSTTRRLRASSAARRSVALIRYLQRKTRG